MDIQAFRSLVENMNERGEIENGPNIKSLVDEAKAVGLIRPHPSGKFKIREPAHKESVMLLGKEIPIVGEWWDIFILTEEGQALLGGKDD